MVQQYWFFRAVLLSCGLLGWLGDSLASPAIDSAMPVSSGRPFIHVEAGRVSVKIEDTSLSEILKEIGTQSGVTLVLHGSRPEKVSARFQSVPLDEALRRLIKDNFLFLYSSGTDRPEVEVWIVNSGTSLSSFVATTQKSARPILPKREASLDSLLQELQEGNAEQRQQAVWMLGDFKDKKAVAAVKGALEGDEDPDVRKQAAWVLEELGDPQSVDALAEAVSGDEDESVRQRAVESLAKLGGQEAVEPLSLALREDSDPFVRYEALTNLTDIGGDGAEASLFAALNDPDELVRTKAEELLEMRGAGNGE